DSAGLWGCAIDRRCSPRVPRSRRRNWYAISSAASRTSTPTGAGCWRSSTPRLRFLQPLAETLDQLRERRVPLHLDAQVPYTGVVDALAAAGVDRQLARAEDFQRLLERLRAACRGRPRGARPARYGFCGGPAR